MNQTPTPSSSSSSSSPILQTLGEEILRILYPVSLCMLLVVLLVSSLSSPLNTTSSSIPTLPSSSDSIYSKLSAAFLNSLLFVATITLLTFLLLLLFYFRCTPFLKSYLAFSSFTVLFFLGGQTSILLLSRFSLPLDAFSFLLLLFNFSLLGILSISLAKLPIALTQGYLVVIAVFVAYWFTLLPEWTTWSLLISMALYDLAAVLLPVGPLRLLVEMAIARDEEIPALVYEARPVEIRVQESGEGSEIVEAEVEAPLVLQNGRMREARERVEGDEEIPALVYEARPVDPPPRVEIRLQESGEGSEIVEAEAPLVLQHERRREAREGVEGIGLGSSGAIKLGLGDFIFYSVLVGRAAMYDFMTVYACYLAIVAGLGITLLLLSVYRKALPALPISIALGVLFYVLTRELLEVFVLQCSMNLLMF